MGLLGLSGAVLGDGFEGVVEVLGGVDGVVNPDELLVVKEVADAGGAVVRVRNLKAIAHGAVGVTKEREGESVFFGEGELLRYGVHGNSDSAHFCGL